MSKPLALTLPWPPSINHYWRRVGTRTHISHEGRRYRRAVAEVVMMAPTREPLTGRLSLRIIAHQPDRRARDLDNLLKAPLDALEHAGVYRSDSQIDRLSIERQIDREAPRLDVLIVEF